MIISQLPELFVQRERALLGPRFDAMFSYPGQGAVRGASVNALRCTPQQFAVLADFPLEASPFCASAFVVPQPDWKPGRHPYHHAGAFYAQEPSASAPAALLDVHPGMRVADLCAAPGGKTSQLAAALAGHGVLLANEFVAARAEVLRQNLERMGVTNAIVTNEDTARLAAAYPGQFDRILVDAPCSGEGMFRKTPEARDEWSENNVKICAVRQAEILREAWKTLRPGGLLIYSTCTFNRLENEGSLEGLLAEAGEEIVESTAFDCPPAWGVVCGRVGPFRTFRFYPHRTRGEGFFAAVARKVSDGGSRVRVPKSRRTIFAPAGRRECAELARWVAEPGRMRFAAVADVYYAYYESQYEAVKMLAESLRVIASGVAMGQIFKERLKPDHALAMFCGLDRGAVPVAELSEEEALRFLRKQEAEAAAFAEGMNLVTRGGAALGFAKRIQNRVNNMYPNSLRIFNL